MAMAAMLTAAAGAAVDESWSPQDKPSVPSRSGGQQVYPVYVVPKYFNVDFKNETSSKRLLRHT